jgi:hypothetical protein
MWTLIGRELWDHGLYIMLTGLISACAVAVAIATAYWNIVVPGLGIVAGMAVTLFFVFCTLGTAQMYGDRANRISGLLGTLAATRSRILAARVLAGVAVILLGLVPLLIAAAANLYFADIPLAFYRGTLVEVFMAAILTGFTCYCMGLSLGWTTSKTIPVLGLFFSTTLFVLLVAAKGFWLQGIVLLLLLCIAILTRVWYRFTSVSL